MSEEIAPNTCKDCLFFRMPGECRKYPPKVVTIVETIRTGYSDTPVAQSYPMTVFPNAPLDGWCGEFRHRDRSKVNTLLMEHYKYL